ncbi:unnamed protein product [Vitrella brassicaformis CCMP3155]|uniref:Methyltransferase type 11 domain-containing protein n=1 Tax=Vitrella brassicaformis (strain CCMP3155) TaxID=1169540 RepID=A0A0G4GFM5_VITBC|nr:unnamed protein product [Vitrella brassicaformis CCMP3155]|eukprot:CEM28101.1 unnamed protein product [Vitrella brassicaformis CCMP3155]
MSLIPSAISAHLAVLLDQPPESPYMASPSSIPLPWQPLSVAVSAGSVAAPVLAFILYVIFRVATYFSVQVLTTRALQSMILPRSIVVEMETRDAINFYYYPRDVLRVTCPGVDSGNSLKQKAVTEGALQNRLPIEPRQEAFVDLKVPDGSVDCVVSTGAISRHVGDPLPLLMKAAELLRPGGQLLLLEPIRGGGPIGGLRGLLGFIHSVTAIGSNPGRDLEGLMASEPLCDVFDYEVVQEGGNILDPFVVAIAKRKEAVRSEEDAPVGEKVPITAERRQQLKKAKTQTAGKRGTGKGRRR